MGAYSIGALTPTTNTSLGSSNITALDAGSSTTTGALGQSIITGVATANSFAAFALTNGNTQSIDVQITGTFVQTLQAEGSIDGGTTWTPILLSVNGSSSTSSTLTSQVVATANVGGMTNFRMRCTAFTSGTAVVKVNLSSALEISGGSGSGVAADVAITGFANTGTLNDSLFNTAASATSTNTSSVSAGNTSSYKSASVQFVMTGTTVTAGAVTFEGSNDNTTFVSIPVFDQTTNAKYFGPISLVTMFVGTIGKQYSLDMEHYKFVRLRISTAMTGTGSPTVQAITNFSALPYVAPQLGVKYSYYRNIALSNAPQTIKNAMSNIYGYRFVNPDASNAVYVKFFDAASGGVTLGTTTPFFVQPIAPNSVLEVEVTNIAQKQFTSGLSVAVTTALADGSTAAPASSVYAEVVYA